jgi:hypothetical protein
MPSFGKPTGTVQPIQVLQIVIGAMLMGIVTFAVVVVVVRASGQDPQPPMPGKPLISYVAIAVAIGSLVFREVVGAAVVGAGLRKIVREGQRAGTSVDRAAQLAGFFQKKTIIAAAMTEGPALFLLVAYLLEGNAAALIVAILLAASLAMLFPTQSRLTDWMETRRRRLESEGVG